MMISEIEAEAPALAHSTNCEQLLSALIAVAYATGMELEEFILAATSLWEDMMSSGLH